MLALGVVWWIVITHLSHFIWRRGSCARPVPDMQCRIRTPDNTRGTWAREAATVAFYNLFIPLSLRWSNVSEGKINFTLYLNVKSFGFDRISFQIVLINLLLRRSKRAAVDMGTHYEYSRRVIVLYSVMTAVSVQGNNRFNWKSVNKFVGDCPAVVYVAGGLDKLDRLRARDISRRIGPLFLSPNFVFICSRPCLHYNISSKGLIWASWWWSRFMSLLSCSILV